MIAEKLGADPNFILKDGVFFQKNFTPGDFEQDYIDIRKREGRIFEDRDLSKLPEVEKSHSHFKEWKIRKRSTERLTKYIDRHSRAKTILEIGCGNGWLSNKLSLVKSADVIGLDINVTELRQGARVFNHLNFIAADVFTLSLPITFEYAVLASSIQYFDNLKKLLNTVSGFLSNNGEIHILDSPIYPSVNDANNAKQRSGSYFKSQESKMTGHYHHHTWDALSDFNYHVLYNPQDLKERVKNKFMPDSPFPWIKINKF